MLKKKIIPALLVTLLASTGALAANNSLYVSGGVKSLMVDLDYGNSNDEVYTRGYQLALGYQINPNVFVEVDYFKTDGDIDDTPFELDLTVVDFVGGYKHHLAQNHAIFLKGGLGFQKAELNGGGINREGDRNLHSTFDVGYEYSITPQLFAGIDMGMSWFETDNDDDDWTHGYQTSLELGYRF